jgi:hypothetical protein
MTALSVYVTPTAAAANPDPQLGYQAAVGQVIQVPPEHAALLTQRGWRQYPILDTMIAITNAYTYLVPSTGFNIAAPSGAQIDTVIIDPAGTLATGTIVMPAAPADGEIFEFQSSQIVTTLTVSSPGQTTKNAPATIAANTTLSWRYRAANLTWYRRF